MFDFNPCHVTHVGGKYMLPNGCSFVQHIAVAAGLLGVALCSSHLNAFIGKKSEEYVYRQAQYKFDRIIKKP